MDSDTTAKEGTSCKYEDAKILLSVNETSEPGHVLELVKRGHAVPQDDLDSALISACQQGHKGHVYDLVQHGANIQKKDTNGNTPLLICAENGFIDIARFLVTQKADINTKNCFLDNALILSIHPAKSVEMVKLLLEQKRININHQNKEGYTALMKAIEAKDIQLIRLLLDAKGSTRDLPFKLRNCKNETAQEIADRAGIGNAVRLLLKHKNVMTSALLATVHECDVGSFNVLIDSPFSDAQKKKATIQKLFEALFMKHKGMMAQTFNESEVNILKKLLECGADPNKKRLGFDPLLTATEVGSYRVLQLLCEHGAALNSQSLGKDSLDIAAEKGRADLLELLLKYKTKIKQSSLDLALMNGHTDCAKLLIKNGANMDIKHTITSAVLQQHPGYLKCLLENFKYEVRNFARTRDMADLLVFAAEGGNLEIIGLILDAGANVNCTNKHGKTPLMQSKDAEVVHFLVKKGAVVNKWRKFQSENSSPLTYILSCNRFRYDFARRDKIIQALLEHGANVNGRSCGGRSAIMIAASKSRSKNIIQMFLERDADVSMMDNKGNTALLIATQENLTENLTCLLQHKKGPNVINVQNHEGVTALMVASEKCNHLAVKELLEHGADVNIKDLQGNTALLHALRNICGNREEILTTLIGAGSDINCQNNDCFSPLMLAAKSSLTDSIKVLVKSGADINVVSKNSSTGTALSVLLKNARLGQDTQDCMEYLLDQGARASYISPDVFHRLIHYGELKCVPRLIQCGLGPADVKALELPPIISPTHMIFAVSPLCMALLTGNAPLARYFLGNLFLTSSDLSSLTTNKDLRVALEKKKYTECLDLLDEISTQVMSLFKLAFVAVQSAVGAAPGREERVSMLPLPQVIKDKLLFKTEDVHLDITAVNKPSSETLSLVDQLRLISLLSSSYISLDHYDFDSDIDYYDEYFEYDDDYSDW